MRTFFLLILAAGCNPVSTIEIKDASTVDTGPDTDTDTGTNTDDTADTGDTAEDPDVPDVIPDAVVDCEGSADYESIQEAIDDAVSPANIAVKPCVYRERLDFLGKDINLYGLEGSSETTIDGEEGGTLIDIEFLESGNTRVAGFTLTGGNDAYAGAVFEVYSSTVELEDLVIEDNTGLTLIQSLYGSIDMVDVTIEDNDVDSTGSAIYADGGSIIMSRTHVDCDGGAQALWHHVQVVVADSSLVCNSGYAIHDYHGYDYILRSTLYGSTAGIYAYDNENLPEEPDSPSEWFFVENSVIGGGSVGADVRYMTVYAENSVFYGDDAALSLTAVSGSSTLVNNVYAKSACGILSDTAVSDSYSAYWDNTENGCGIRVNPEFEGDPKFVDFPDDVTLEPDSRLIDAGSPSLRDTDGSDSDIGRYGGPRGGW